MKLSPILRRSTDGLLFWCPGCEELHHIVISSGSRPNWSWNGDAEKPTFQPSILVRTGAAIDPSIAWEEGDPPLVCHSYVTDGRIQFLGDCTHALAGQTVGLPPVDQEGEA